MAKPDVIRDIVRNRKARHHYLILDTFEAGIALQGSEVKSLRMGNANLQEAHVAVRADGAWLHGCHIAHYAEANQFNHNPTRVRRLLLHRHELSKLRKSTSQKGTTIVPLRIYMKGSWVKVEIALAKGKKLHDKRHTLKAKQSKRDMGRSR